MLQLPNKIEKLEVRAFKTDDRKGSEESFEFFMSPESIKSRHENQFSRSRGINTSGRSAPYAYSISDELIMQLILDNSVLKESLPGIPSSPGDPVKQQVEKFLKFCFYMDGDIHEPRFLLLEWGDFGFECRLKSVHVSFSNFDDQGEPLRATLDTVFVADMPAAKRIRLENKKSPDITHTRTILHGQTLTGLTKEIYGDASHYMMVAQANQLDHFRKLEPGEQLHFPPLKP